MRRLLLGVASRSGGKGQCKALVEFGGSLDATAAAVDSSLLRGAGGAVALLAQPGAAAAGHSTRGIAKRAASEWQASPEALQQRAAMLTATLRRSGSLQQLHRDLSAHRGALNEVHLAAAALRAAELSAIPGPSSWHSHGGNRGRREQRLQPGEQAAAQGGDAWAVMELVCDELVGGALEGMRLHQAAALLSSFATVKFPPPPALVAALQAHLTGSSGGGGEAGTLQAAGPEALAQLAGALAAARVGVGDAALLWRRLATAAATRGGSHSSSGDSSVTNGWEQGVAGASSVAALVNTMAALSKAAAQASRPLNPTAATHLRAGWAALHRQVVAVAEAAAAEAAAAQAAGDVHDWGGALTLRDAAVALYAEQMLPDLALRGHIYQQQQQQQQQQRDENGRLVAALERVAAASGWAAPTAPPTDARAAAQLAWAATRAGRGSDSPLLAPLRLVLAADAAALSPSDLATAAEALAAFKVPEAESLLAACRYQLHHFRGTTLVRLLQALSASPTLGAPTAAAAALWAELGPALARAARHMTPDQALQVLQAWPAAADNSSWQAPRPPGSLLSGLARRLEAGTTSGALPPLAAAEAVAVLATHCAPTGVAPGLSKAAAGAAMRRLEQLPAADLARVLAALAPCGGQQQRRFADAAVPRLLQEWGRLGDAAAGRLAAALAAAGNPDAALLLRLSGGSSGGAAGSSSPGGALAASLASADSLEQLAARVRRHQALLGPSELAAAVASAARLVVGSAVARPAPQQGAGSRRLSSSIGQAPAVDASGELEQTELNFAAHRAAASPASAAEALVAGKVAALQALWGDLSEPLASIPLKSGAGVLGRDALAAAAATVAAAPQTVPPALVARLCAAAGAAASPPPEVATVAALAEAAAAVGLRSEALWQRLGVAVERSVAATAAGNEPPEAAVALLRAAAAFAGAAPPAVASPALQAIGGALATVPPPPAPARGTAADPLSGALATAASALAMYPSPPPDALVGWLSTAAAARARCLPPLPAAQIAAALSQLGVRCPPPLLDRVCGNALERPGAMGLAEIAAASSALASAVAAEAPWRSSSGDRDGGATRPAIALAGLAGRLMQLLGSDGAAQALSVAATEGPSADSGSPAATLPVPLDPTCLLEAAEAYASAAAALQGPSGSGGFETDNNSGHDLTGLFAAAAGVALAAARPRRLLQSAGPEAAVRAAELAARPPGEVRLGPGTREALAAAAADAARRGLHELTASQASRLAATLAGRAPRGTLSGSSSSGGGGGAGVRPSNEAARLMRELGGFIRAIPSSTDLAEGALQQEQPPASDTLLLDALVSALKGASDGVDAGCHVSGPRALAALAAALAERAQQEAAENASLSNSSSSSSSSSDGSHHPLWSIIDGLATPSLLAKPQALQEGHNGIGSTTGSSKPPWGQQDLLLLLWALATAPPGAVSPALQDAAALRAAAALPWRHLGGWGLSRVAWAAARGAQGAGSSSGSDSEAWQLLMARVRSALPAALDLPRAAPDGFWNAMAEAAVAGLRGVGSGSGPPFTPRQALVTLWSLALCPPGEAPDSHHLTGAAAGDLALSDGGAAAIGAEPGDAESEAAAAAAAAKAATVWRLGRTALEGASQLSAAELATLAWALGEASSTAALTSHCSPVTPATHPATADEEAVRQLLPAAVQSRWGEFGRPELLLLARAAARMRLWEPGLWAQLAHGTAAHAACLPAASLADAAAAFAPAARRFAAGNTTDTTTSSSSSGSSSGGVPSEGPPVGRALRQLYRSLGRAALYRLEQMTPPNAAALADAFAAAGQRHDALAAALAARVDAATAAGAAGHAADRGGDPEALAALAARLRGVW